MTQYGPSSAFLLVGGKNISSDTFQLSETLEQKLEDARGLGENWERSLPVGVGKVTLAASGGFYDDRVAGINEALQDQGQTRQLVSYGMAGNAIGAEAVMIDGIFASKWIRQAARDGLTKANAEYVVSGVPYRGKVLHHIFTETSDPGNTEGPSVDNAASSAFGLIADLHVPTLVLGGYTSVTVKVRHSADDVTYADLITFTTVTLPGASQRVTVAGTVNRHLAISWDFIGAGSGQSVVPYVVAYRPAA